MSHNLCFLCESKDSEECANCKLIFSCKLHLAFHRQKNLSGCYPWKVGKIDGKGRVLVATRIIHPLELVFEDNPVGLSPLQDSPHACLHCFRLLGDSPKFFCDCGFPMCDEKCSKGTKHQIECQVFKKSSPTLKPLQDYQLILPIRMLSEIDSDPILKSRTDLLMSHEGERRAETNNWNYIHQNVVIPIRERLGMTQWSEDTIQWSIGVNRTNATQTIGTGAVVQGDHGDELIKMEDSEVATARVLYPTMSLMSHSCQPNIRTINAPHFGLECRALRKIEPGEELTISYAEFLSDAASRKADIERNWFFVCACRLCTDPTDLGSYVNAVQCRKCHQTVIQSDPLATSDWACMSCGSTYPHSVIQPMVESAKELLTSGPGEDDEDAIDYFEEFLEKHSTILHPNHCCLVRAKMKLIRAYKAVSNLKQMTRKVTLCKDILAVLDIINPGYSGPRGLILYELSAPMGAILEVEFRDGRIEKSSFISGLSEVKTIVEECIKCLEVEHPGTYRKMICENAKRVLSGLNEIIQFSEFL